MKRRLELVSVKAQLFAEGEPLPSIAVEMIQHDNMLWYCEGGSDLGDDTVVSDQGYIESDITVFELEWPASLGYALCLYDAFGAMEWEFSIYGQDFIQNYFPELARLAKALLDPAQQRAPQCKAVQFLSAWEIKMTEAGWIGSEYYQEAEIEYELLGWVNITVDGMTIVTIEQLENQSQESQP